MQLKKYLIFSLLSLFILTAVCLTAQNQVLSPDSIHVRQEQLSDSLFISNDSTAILNDSTVQVSPNSINSPVNYQAVDSMVVLGTKFMYLYKESNVKYTNLEISAETISVDIDKSLVHATFGLDSIGDETGYPIFKDGDTQYESKTMDYNFKTKKGFSTALITQQGEGYVTAGQTKKLSNNDLYMVDGKYTTCDVHDHPHFYLQLTKAKVKPKKNIVTGPAYLVIEDVPLPLAIPFGFFPFSDDYSSGIIMPTYGDEMVKGFCLRDGGYYFAFNDYIDLALTGEIYTKGSWGLAGRSSYRKRYKFSGNANVAYVVTITGDKDSGDYSRSNDMRINWTHSQDQKANPYLRLSANVAYSTTSYNQNRATVERVNYTDNTKNSSVTLTKTFPANSLSLNLNLAVNQTTRDTMISLTMPNMSIAYGQTYPFRRKQVVGDLRWYEQIYFSYSGSLRNSIRTKEYNLMKSNILKDWSNSMTHSIPVSASFNAFKYINISPNFNYTENWMTKKVEQGYDSEGRQMPVDTTYGFYRTYQYNVGVSVNTKLYGFFTPWRKLFGDKVQTIRHVFTPRMSFSGSPDFGDPRYGFYNTIQYTDGEGKTTTNTYSPYAIVPGAGKSASVSFGFDNNVEMKIKSDSDSTGVKKISLLDNLSFNSGYNFLATTRPWSDISANLRLKITKSYTFNAQATFDTYVYDENAKPVETRWAAGKGIGRLRSTGTSFGYTFNNDTFKKWFGKEDDESKDDSKGSNQSTTAPGEEEAGASSEQSAEGGGYLRKKKDKGDFDSDGYMVANVPWSLSFNWSLNLGYGQFNPEKKEYDYMITQGLGFNGNITPSKGWTFSFNTNYDFEAKKIVTMQCNLTRDLHCWAITASFIPMGPYQSYNLTLAVKSSLLQDLKYTQHGTSQGAVQWE